jgi:hypothetical protein
MICTAIGVWLRVGLQLRICSCKLVVTKIFSRAATEIFLVASELQLRFLSCNWVATEKNDPHGTKEYPHDFFCLCSKKSRR